MNRVDWERERLVVYGGCYGNENKHVFVVLFFLNATDMCYILRHITKKLNYFKTRIKI